ncbi:MAG: glycosyltransferase [Tepidisphaeraceae bacterium]
MFDLSILLPTCNDGRLLLRTFMEIDRRTHVPHEVIVYDRGSDDDITDGALNLAHSIMGSRLIIIRGGPQVNLATALNRCAERAKAQTLAWWFADATPTESALDFATERVRSQSNHMLAALAVDRTALQSIAREITVGESMFAVGAIDDRPIAELGVVSKSLLKSLGGFDESLDGATAVADVSLRAAESMVAVDPLPLAGVERRRAEAIDIALLRQRHPLRRAA